MSLAIRIEVAGLADADARLARLNPLDQETLLQGLARYIQQQTRNRIFDEKTSPAGEAWKPNLAKTSILHRSGALARSIDYAVSGAQAIVGSGLIYAAVHQFGATIRAKNARALAFRLPGAKGMIFVKSVTIPARPYIGLSAENRAELLRAAASFIRARLG